MLPKMPDEAAGSESHRYRRELGQFHSQKELLRRPSGETSPSGLRQIVRILCIEFGGVGDRCTDRSPATMRCSNSYCDAGQLKPPHDVFAATHGEKAFLRIGDRCRGVVGVWR